MSKTNIRVIRNVPLPGAIRLVANGEKGQLTVSIEIDEEGFPVVDLDFDGAAGRVWQVDGNGDPSDDTDVEPGRQVVVTLQ